MHIIVHRFGSGRNIGILCSVLKSLWIEQLDKDAFLLQKNEIDGCYGNQMPTNGLKMAKNVLFTFQIRPI